MPSMSVLVRLPILVWVALDQFSAEAGSLQGDGQTIADADADADADACGTLA